MEEHNIRKIMLAQYVRRLYTVSGKLNLYINICCENSTHFVDRINSELQRVKEIVANIEAELDDY